MGCGIYKITNLVNKKVYVGSSVDVASREYKHFWMLKRGSHDNEYLQKSFNKHGRDNFIFEVIDYCDLNELIKKENEYIEFYESNNLNKGFNLSTVNEFRRNTYNDEVKIKLSKHNLRKNGNIEKYSLTNMNTNEEFIFDSLVDGANYLIKKGFAKGNPRNVRMKISNSLRGVKVNNGKDNNGSIRKTCYNHKFKIIK